MKVGGGKTALILIMSTNGMTSTVITKHKPSKLPISLQPSVKSDNPLCVISTEKKKLVLDNDGELFSHIRLPASIGSHLFSEMLYTVTSLFDETRPRMPWHVGPLLEFYLRVH